MMTVGSFSRTSAEATVEGAAKALERVSQLVELGIEASSIVVFKPVRKKVSVTFDDT